MYNLAMPLRGRPPRRGKFVANQRLREIREERGLSQAKLAELIGCSQADIQRLETGHTQTTTEWQLRLAPHLGVDPRDVSPLAAGPARPAEGGGLDADIMRRAMAVARRWGRDEEPWIPDVVSLFYSLLAQEKDGHPITDNEPTLALIDIFVRRLRSNFPSR